MGAHLALTQEGEDRNLGAVPDGSIAKWSRQQVAALRSSVRIRVEPPNAGRCQTALTPVQKTVGNESWGIDTSVRRHVRLGALHYAAAQSATAPYPLPQSSSPNQSRNALIRLKELYYAQVVEW